MIMKIIFVLGPIGAGKTFYITKVLLKLYNITYLSSDELMLTNNLTYEVARNQMHYIMQDYIKNNKSFIIEGTGQHLDLYDLLKDLYNNREIDLKIIYINIGLPIALQRNQLRKRVLDDHIVKEVFYKSMENRNLWQDFDCEYIDYNDILIDDID